MFIIVFLAAFAAVALTGWIIYALTHPILAGRGALIVLSKAAGFIALLTALAAWIGQSLLHAVVPALFMIVFFAAANKLESRWRRW